MLFLLKKIRSFFLLQANKVVARFLIPNFYLCGKYNFKALKRQMYNNGRELKDRM